MYLSLSQQQAALKKVRVWRLAGLPDTLLLSSD